MDEKSAGSAGTFFSLLFFAQGGKERDPEEEELEGEADPGEGVVPGGVVEVLDAKGAFVEKEALIPEDPAADSGGDEEENEDDEEGEAFSPDGFFEAAGGVFQDGVGFCRSMLLSWWRWASSSSTTEMPRAWERG